MVLPHVVVRRRQNPGTLMRVVPMRRLLSSRSRTLCAFVTTFTLLAFAAPNASAQTRQFDDVLRGDIQLIGNVNLECDPTLNARDCSNIHSGADQQSNNRVRRRWIDIDDANFNPPASTEIATADTYNSSSMFLDLPVGATVVEAQLSYQGVFEDITFTDSKRPTDLNDRFDRAFFGTEAAGYARMDATQCVVRERNVAGTDFLPGSIANSANGASFQDCYDAYTAKDNRIMTISLSNVDVTAMVQQQGSGDYYVADIPTTQKPGKQFNFAHRASWVMWVVYEDGGTLRRIFIDSNSGGIGSGNPTNEIIIDYSDFVTPLTGPVTGRFIAAVGDGDYAGYAKIDGVKISDTVNPENQLWQHNISVLGTENVQRDPGFSNNLDIDINVFDVSSYLSNDAQSVSLELGGATSSNGIGFNLLGFSVQVRTGDIIAEKRVSAVNGSAYSPGDRIRPGDTVTYELTMYNDGEGDAINTILTDPVPGGTTYVANSLRYKPSGGAFATPTDTVGDDVCQFDGGSNQVTCFLGSGANPSIGKGGLVDEAIVTSAAPIKFTFNVTINTEGGSVVTENQATVKFTDFTGTTTGTAVSNDPTSAEDGDPTSVAVCGNTIVEDGEDCDAGSGNGATTCTCTSDCAFPSMLVVCSDGNFCTDEDSCDGAGACVAGGQSPCSGGAPVCDESNDECDECAGASDCQDNSSCNGAETCDASGTCQSGTATVCQANESCVEASNTCVCDVGFVRDGDGVGDCVLSQCDDAADCDDSNLCTEDICLVGICSNTPDIGASCDNGDFCDGVGACNATGACVEPGTPCGGSTPFCDEANNECDECASASDCSDSLTCNGSEVCDSSGSCQNGTAVTCSANSSCTEPGGNCQCDAGFVPNSDPTGAGCVPRECTLDIDCGDSNICTVDSCEGGLCVNGIMNGASCDNGDFCDGAGACDASGVCVEPGTPCTGNNTICDEFEDQCEACVDDSNTTTDTGCDSTNPFCDDSDASNPICVACEVAADCGATSNDCTLFACNAGVCDEEAVSNGSSCTSDGAFCTGAETCQIGACQSAGDPCRSGAPLCDEIADVCVECEADADCDDSVACNGDELCSAGVCQTGSTVVCDANEVCGEPSGTCACQPGFVDDGAGTCVASQCTDAADCDDINVCTADTCVGGLCSFDPSNTGGDCDNGTFCDGAGTCDTAGSCVEPGNPCATTDSPVCDEASDVCIVCVDNSDDSTDRGCTSDVPFCDESDPANPVCVACETAADCGVTGNECSTFACNVGVCEEESLSNGASCTSDGAFCTGIESCQAGICAGAGSPCSGGTPFCDDAADVCLECEVDGDCSDSLVCNGDEICDTGVCEFGTAVACGTNETCTEPAGACACAVGFVDGGSGNCIVPACDTDDDCEDTNVCTSDSCVDNVCAFVPSNDGDDCGGGNVCDAGVCGPECVIDADCDAGEICDAGVCGPECTQDMDCSGSEICDVPTDGSPNACVPECTQDTDCESGEVCNAINVCTPECNDNADCPGTQVCDAGVCGPECLTDVDCPDGSGCSATSATCEPECVTAEDCNGDDVCSADGVCTTPCTTTTDCLGGEICETSAGVCVPECLDDADCGTGEVCDGTTNTCGPECTTGAECEGVLICDASTSTCVAECTSDDDCGTGETCDRQTLTCEPVCGDDSDCDAGEACLSEMCVTECTTVADCDGSEACSADGICVPECQLSGDCVPVDVCDPSLNCQTPGCDEDGDCPSAQPFCDVGSQLCVECLSATDCPDDGLFCNGAESCSGAVCESSGSPCATGETCTEDTGTCTETPDGGTNEDAGFVFTGGSRNCSSTGGRAPLWGMLLVGLGLVALRRRRDEEE